MKQYWEIKSQYKNEVVLFRMGDFYEMFFDDAVLAAPILNIALTSRNKKSEDQTPMCGVPYHSIAGPIQKLLAAGKRVALCEQVEDPKLAIGIVKRKVLKVFTPGIVYDFETLEAGKSHFLASHDEEFVSFVDVSTGECFFIRAENEKLRAKILEKYSVAEYVTAPELSADESLPISARRLLQYVRTLAGDQIVLRPFQERNISDRMDLRPTTQRHLEFFKTTFGDEIGSFFWSIDRTETSVGKRLFREWLQFPLQNLDEILKRQMWVRKFREKVFEIKKLRQLLKSFGDLERKLTKLTLSHANARDLLAIAHNLEVALNAAEIAKNIGYAIDFSDTEQLSAEIRRTIVEDPPLLTKQGMMIQRLVDPGLDEWIDLSSNAQGLLHSMEIRERERTGIPSLKIRYNNVFGYFIEITHTHAAKAPAHYKRKQTLANAERFYTDELLELEKKILSSHSRRSELEFQIYDDLRKKVLSSAGKILNVAAEIAKIDLYASFAWLSIEQKYCTPKVHAEKTLHLIASRHPVIEQMMSAQKNEYFVANDISITQGDVILLTGPNMAGKSTLMRQVALSVIMAHIGMDVPANQAEIPLTDAVFTRIGANDQLSQGLSTFMVEMKETAELLEFATSKSLLVLDEIGRGTSTFDGMCLAQSILEYLLSQVRCRTLFATHYHELTNLAAVWPQISNQHMAIQELKDTQQPLRFLYALKSGAAQKSYGVQVAQLAGLPRAVTKRAQELLVEKELKSKVSLDLQKLNDSHQSDFSSYIQDLS